MSTKRRSRTWWQQTVARWQRSGLTAAEFAAREGLSARTLSWWTSTLRRGTRAMRGPGGRTPVTSGAAVAPIEIDVPRLGGQSHAEHRLIEILVGGVVVRVDPGLDVAYVVELVRRLGASAAG